MRLLALAVLLAGCQVAAPPAATPAPAPAQRASDDAPLPAPDEVPLFLQPARRAPAAVALEVEKPIAEPAPPEPAAAPEIEEEPEPAAEPEAVPEAAPVEAPAADPCADIAQAMRVRSDYLDRASSERDRFGFLQGRDATALRLLDGLRRCKAHPEDPDCKPAPMEVDISHLEKQAAAVERHPDELVADAADPDAVIQDPVMVDLDRRLTACRKSQVAQPLLERGP